MDISILTTTNDIEQLHAMALAMVQNSVSENADKEKLCQHNADLQQRIRLLEEALILARQHRFGRKTETMAGLQRQLFEEDLDADIAATEAQIRTLLQQNEMEDKVPPSHPVRKPLPAHLPRVTKPSTPRQPKAAPTVRGRFASSAMKSVKNWNISRPASW